MHPVLHVPLASTADMSRQAGANGAQAGRCSTHLSIRCTSEPNFQKPRGLQACIARGLLEDDSEFDHALAEAAEVGSRHVVNLMWLSMHVAAKVALATTKNQHAYSSICSASSPAYVTWLWIDVLTRLTLPCPHARANRRAASPVVCHDPGLQQCQGSTGTLDQVPTATIR